MQTAPQTLLTAEVTDTKDPDSLGRVQVKLLAYGAEVVLPWLRVVQPIASTSHGALFLPEIGDEVAVLCGAGREPDGMLVLGGLYNSANKPKNPEADGKNNLKQLITRTGHTLSFDDTDGAELIEIIASGAKVAIRLNTADGLVSVIADKDVTVKTDGNVTIDAAKIITVKTADKIVIEAKDVNLTATGNVDVKASSGSVSVSAKDVSVTATASCTVKATGQLELSGATVMIG